MWRILPLTLLALITISGTTRVVRQTEGFWWMKPDGEQPEDTAGRHLPEDNGYDDDESRVVNNPDFGSELDSYPDNQPESYNPNPPQPQPHNPVDTYVSDYPYYDPDECVCVPYYLCKDDEIITDGEGLIDVRIGNKQECENYLDVCCHFPVEDGEATPKPPQPYQHVCGVRNENGLSLRILGLGDTETQYGEFPWMTAVIREEGPDAENKINFYVCGGSLIHPQVVLTAAHCVYDYRLSPEVLKVRLGEWDTQSSYELYEHQDRHVKEVQIRRDFNRRNLRNDVALLFLEEPVELAPNVDTVCLPDQDERFDYTQCWATGWGKNAFEGNGTYQLVLKKIDLPVVPHYDCEATMKTTRLGPYFRLHRSFLCAGGERGKDTCKGDGGSPLVCPSIHDPTRYVQAGIVAWGIGCGEAGVPGVYADVGRFSQWIDDAILRYFQLDNSYYSNQWEPAGSDFDVSEFERNKPV